MASQRNKRTDAELKAASEAVDYETTMLWATLEILLSSNTNILSRAAAQAQSNMALHSFLLATRNLCGFLYSRSPYPTDIIAEDFFDDPQQWYDVRPAVAEEIRDGSLVKLINKRLAHLTWDRASGTHPAWSAFRIAWELAEALEVVASQVSASRLHPTFAPGTVALKTAMQAVIDQHGSVEQVKSVGLSQLLTL